MPIEFTFHPPPSSRPFAAPYAAVFHPSRRVSFTTLSSRLRLFNKKRPYPPHLICSATNSTPSKHQNPSRTSGSCSFSWVFGRLCCRLSVIGASDVVTCVHVFPSWLPQYNLPTSNYPSTVLKQVQATLRILSPIPCDWKHTTKTLITISFQDCSPLFSPSLFRFCNIFASPVPGSHQTKEEDLRTRTGGTVIRFSLAVSH